jgi:CHAT domain-containing protein
MFKYPRLLKFIMTVMLTAILSITTPGLLYQLSPVVASTTNLTQQASDQYRDRRFAEAAALFRQAAQAQTDPIQKALSLSNLSLCYQQMGQWPAANQATTDSLALLQNGSNPIALAQVLDIQGSLLLAQGQAEPALTAWEQSAKLYQQQNQPNRALASQTNQAQALQNMGLHRRAISLLQSSLKLSSEPNATDRLPTQLEAIAPSTETTMALRTLGESLRSMGDLTAARLVLDRSLTIATAIEQADAIPLIQLSLGNTARAQSDTPNALKFYQQAAIAPTIGIRSQAQVNQFSLLLDSNQANAATTLLPQLQSQLSQLPATRSGITTRINLAKGMMRLDNPPVADITSSLITAIDQATSLNDPRLKSYAIGTLGSIYERNQQLPKAKTLTQQALNLSQQVSANEVSYLWQWQLGRILNAEGNIEPAIAAYQGAVSNIKSLRADLTATSSDVQFSFRDTVEPIHRQLVSLLLQSDRANHLETARDVIESLQLVELDNFFREACLSANPALIDQVDQKAAVIYPILLEDQLAIISSIPQAKNPGQRDLRYYKIGKSRSEVEKFASRLREDLDQPNTLELTRPKLQKMYDWLLRPIEQDLASSSVETLVFVLDGALRNVPMAALHDGKQFLVERYSIALTPGLQLLSPKSLKQENLNVLVAGLTEARPPAFAALPNVADEVKTIQAAIPNQLLLNESFTSKNFQERIAAVPFPVLHLATHGQFSSQADDTFILTWDKKLKVNQFSSFLRSTESSKSKALELLVLSACETAAGDDRSALGIAGVAIRSGARSTVATLWRINDEASATLMGEFYRQLSQIKKTGITRAEALRQAQLAILNNPDFEQEPYYWAAYVMIGNWI